MQPVDYQIPLSRWSHTWRAIIVVGLSGLGWSQFASLEWDRNRLWFFADIGLGIICFGLMFFRRRYPVRIALITALASSISTLSGGPATLALVSLATRRRWREIVPVALLSLSASLWLNHLNKTNPDVWFIATTAIASIIGVTVGWGLYIGARRELLTTLRDRADRAESDQFRRAEQSRTAERARIAREMHDVLAHRISMVSMHAGALSYRKDLTPEEIRKTADIIQENSHLALTELREVLGILREGPSDTVPELPQPGIHDIPALVAESRLAGMKITFDGIVGLGLLPDNIGRTLYRIAQEGLTNARKHAPDTLLRLTVEGSPGDGVVVEMQNPLRIGDLRLKTPESGLGLIGLAERSNLSGGRLSHHITSDRVFVLYAWLPWPA